MSDNNLKEYADISSLNKIKSELKDIAKSVGILHTDEKLGTRALRNLIASDRNISTSGSGPSVISEICSSRQHSQCTHDLSASDILELDLLKPSYVKKLQGWTTDIRNIPAIEISVVKNFLCRSHLEEFSKEKLKSYRLSRPWALVKAEAIHPVKYHQLPTSHNFCIVSAQCLPSQSTCEYDVKWLHVVLHKATGIPVSAYCVCTVG
jgi:hypothetical protein